ncbi:AraC family transcriptional regulator [Leptospira gomenensis]|uniref:AraC family transcriptional regulator n=1 Tax=Leptospira gomenensis TaxID=2484974 RepID=A0A5F1YZ06_9LEPT|nr:GyrI-like domain-containing protein [Leptospira gomenensis]TGK36059.1 AraC family transcriptional regulator [Leptospira gomenensis]TGK41805.1 AraC family transcriptional regulator [Leptospira gomenensis]TGK53338.1 AraC family transcriptional regulator [Leptospira gomenensis]TGK64944.1 AraC family transcriptional regulator [Leptospira gomenensis]
MEREIVSKTETAVVGISIVTKNEDEISGRGKIGTLWRRFYEEGILERIPGKKNPVHVLAVYTDYESDETGAYRLLIGAEVESPENVPDGLEIRYIPKGEYTKITSERGPIEKAAVGVWTEIWGDAELKQKRKFAADFELYDQRAADPQDAQLDVFIGIR